MLINGNELLNVPVMSLQTGKELAHTELPIIDPDNLKIVGYQVNGPSLDHTPSYLRTADIREIGNLGIIVDSSDEFITPDDIIVEKDTYELAYELEGKQVIDKKKNKIGRVIGYTLEFESFIIQQLIVKRPFLKSFTNDELLINRSQIVEVNDELIIIKASVEPTENKTAKLQTSYANPFRNAAPQPDAITTTDTPRR